MRLEERSKGVHDDDLKAVMLENAQRVQGCEIIWI